MRATLPLASWRNATRASRQRVRQPSHFPTLPCTDPTFRIDYRFKPSDEPPPNDDEDARRREEEELQRVLELSIQDKGGRRNWNEYSLASSSGAGGSGSQAGTQTSTAPQPAVSASSTPSAAAAAAAAAAVARQQAHTTGYVPSTETQPQTHAQQPQTTTYVTTAESSPQSTAAVPSSPTPSTEAYAVTRVRALHSFEPTEPNELAFEKGDIIKVVNREYKDWWRGQIRGRTGIFPVNYVVRYVQPPTLPSLCLRFWWCSGTSSGTHPNRAGS